MRENNFIPSKEQLIRLKEIGFELPENIHDVVWIFEHAGDPITVSLKWISKELFDEYKANNKFLGMSINKTIPAYRL